MVGEVGQDAMYFLLLFELEFAPGVVQFDDGQGLNEDGRTGGGCVVDDAPDAALEVGLERDDVAAFALRDDRLLQKKSVVGRVDDALEFILYPVVCDAHLAADAGQFGRGVVAHVPTLIQAATDLLYDFGTGLNDAGQVCQAGELDLQTTQSAVEVAGGNEGVAHVEQFRWRQRCPSLSGRHQRADVVRAAQSGVRLGLQQRAGLARRLQPPANLSQVGRWRERARQFCPGGETGVGRQTCQDLGKF